MEEGFYKVTFVHANGASASASVIVKEAHILGRGLSISVYGSFYGASLILNVARNNTTNISPILDDYQAYSFSGGLEKTAEGYAFELDDHTDIPVYITFTKTADLTGDECLTEFID